MAGPDQIRKTLLLAETAHAEDLRSSSFPPRAFEGLKAAQIYAVIRQVDGSGAGPDRFQIILVVAGAGQHEFRGSHLTREFPMAAQVYIFGVRRETESNPREPLHQLRDGSGDIGEMRV